MKNIPSTDSRQAGMFVVAIGQNLSRVKNDGILSQQLWHEKSKPAYRPDANELDEIVHLALTIWPTQQGIFARHLPNSQPWLDIFHHIASVKDTDCRSHLRKGK